MTIAILDFGSQTAQLIARRVREANVYAELFPWDADPAKVLAIQPRGFILSGGKDSVYEPGAAFVPPYVLESGLPILGICYGMQALTHALGGRVAPHNRREFGFAEVQTLGENPLLAGGDMQVWMSHGDRIETPPAGFVPLAQSGNSPIAAMGDVARKRFGVQFHPEVRHTPAGPGILRRFAVNICGASPDWTPGSIIESAIEKIRAQVGDQRVLSAVSGGVDSAVATALVHRAVGDQLVAVFVDNGLMRQGEPVQVAQVFGGALGVNFRAVNAVEEFLDALAGVTDPEQKRKIIGEKFIRIFEGQARLAGMPPFLVQGTIYPDVVESSAPDRAQAAKIKTHHNVGGLPEDMHFRLVEPLRYLFKDEVRAVGEALGLPEAMVWRQPFPGPGLAVRCLGEVTAERLARLRGADAVVTEELGRAGLLRMTEGGGPGAEAGTGARIGIETEGGLMSPVSRLVSGTSQAFAILLPVRSVGVMGDYRTYQEAVAIRAVTTDDFMTADWARLPHEVLARISTRIVNEVPGVNRVVYDVTSKPPATIEWE
jgi:GMP synthase (glutamine-hydrolysing)